MASTIAGWLCPCATHHHDDTASTSRRPSASSISTPDAERASRTRGGDLSEAYGCHMKERSYSRYRSSCIFPLVVEAWPPLRQCVFYHNPLAATIPQPLCSRILTAIMLSFPCLFKSWPYLKRRKRDVSMTKCKKAFKNAFQKHFVFYLNPAQV